MTSPLDHQRPEQDYGVRFWIGVAAGWAIIGFGIHSAFRTFQASNPYHAVIPLILFAVGNDLLLAPLVIVLGLALRRVVRLGPVTATAVGVSLISILVTAFTWPEIRHYGKDPALASSLQTNNFATGLLTVLAVVWALAALALGIRLWLRRRQPPQPRSPRPGRGRRTTG